MAAIGIRELKERTSDVIRRVRDRGETVDVTYRGRLVARLVPVARRSPSTKRATRAVIADIEQLAQEIAARWPPGVSAADAVKEQRRG